MVPGPAGAVLVVFVVVPPVVPVVVADVPFVMVFVEVLAIAPATLVVAVVAKALATLEVAVLASCDVITVADPSGVINVGLTLLVVDALPAITVTCEGIAYSWSWNSAKL
jgi:hypothetical protein